MSELTDRIQLAQVQAAEEVVVGDLRRKGLLPPKLAITIDLDHLRARMARFVAEVAPHDPTAYTIPFETYLQWEQRQRQGEIQFDGGEEVS